MWSGWACKLPPISKPPDARAAPPVANPKRALTGALLRLGACLGVGIDIIEPCGFFMDDRRLRRVGTSFTLMENE